MTTSDEIQTKSVINDIKIQNWLQAIQHSPQSIYLDENIIRELIIFIEGICI